MAPRIPTNADRADRDVFVPKPAPRGIGLTEPPPLAIPHEIGFEATGVLVGAALDEARDDREPLDRIRHLEKRQDRASDAHDALAGTVTEFRVETAEQFGDVKTAVAGVAGQLEGLSAHLERLARRDQATFDDGLDAKKARRRWWIEVVKLGAALAAVATAAFAAGRC